MAGKVPPPDDLRSEFRSRVKRSGAANTPLETLLLPWAETSAENVKDSLRSAWWLRVLDNPWMAMVQASCRPDPGQAGYESLGWPADVREWLARHDGFLRLDMVSDAWAKGESLSAQAALGRCAARMHVLLADRAEAQGHSYLVLSDLLVAWTRHAAHVRHAAEDPGGGEGSAMLPGLLPQRRCLEVPLTEITPVLADALRTPKMMLDVFKAPDGRKCIRRTPVARAEARINELVKEIVHGGGQNRRPRWCRRALEKLARDKLDPDQLGVAEGLFGDRSAGVLHGPPGTGKTHTCASILAAAAAAGARIEAAAPTARAAGRLRELLKGVGGKDLPAPRTVHSLLGSRVPKGADVQMVPGHENAVRPDLLVVDESSMLDTELLGALLRARDPSTRLLLVGDPDQLQPVGCGEPFRVLCQAAAAGGKAGALRTVHRSSDDAPHTALARALHANDRGGLDAFVRATAPGLAGEGPVRGGLINTTGPEAVGPEALPAVLRQFHEHCRDRSTPPMVITAQHEGEWGTRALNRLLKQALNPLRPGVRAEEYPSTRHGLPVTPGDRVIWTGRPEMVGRRGQMLVNGDFCEVLDLKVEADRSHTLQLRLSDGERVVMQRHGLVQSLEHAWAITCHRAQGSEAPLVVYCPEARNPGMVYRNLAYTAITRPREMLVLIGSPDRMKEAFHEPAPGRQTLPSLPEPPYGAAELATERPKPALRSRQAAFMSASPA